MGWGGLWALGFPDGPLSGSLGGGRRLSRSPGPLQGVWGAVTRDASACALVLTAEVYIGIGKPAEATACTQEAANLFPMSHNVLYMRGQVAELRGNVDEARRWYEEALSISPTHVKSMQRLVSPGAPLRGSGSSGPSAHVPVPDALAGRGLRVRLPRSGLCRWSSRERAVHRPPGRLGRLRAESGSEASGQPAKPPCGSGLSEHVLVTLGAVILLLVSALSVAAPLGGPHPGEPVGRDSEHFPFSGAPWSQERSLSPRPLGGRDIRSEEGGQPPCTVRTQGSHPSLP